MTRILHIDSSASPFDASYTRRVSAAVVEALRAGRPDTEVIRHDLADAPPPHIDGALRGGWTATPDQRTPSQVEIVTRSEGLIAELKSADALVIGAPMYNFSVPSTLKAWIDHVVIAGQTFRYTSEGKPEGLVTGKTAFLVLASGGVYSEGPGAALEHRESYLRGVLGFIGITDVRAIRVEGLAFGPDHAATALASALEEAGRAGDGLRRAA